MKWFNRPGQLVLALLLLAVTFTASAEDTDPFVISFLPTDLGYNPIVTYTTTEAQLYTGLFEGLVSYDPYSLDPLPGVANRWEVSDDGKTYRFFLRGDAQYSNGDPVTAADFRDTWIRLLAPETGAAYASLLDVVVGVRDFRTGVNTDPEALGFSVASERVLEVELNQRATHFLRILCHHSFVPLHPEMLDLEDWDNPTELIVNGPYTITQATDESLTLTRNEEYWDRRKVSVETIRAEFSEEYTQVTEAFNRGDIDWVRGGIDLDGVENREAIVLNALFATTYFQYSASEEPLADTQVRQALTLALPWEEIRADQYQYLPADSLVPALPEYPKVSGYSARDMDRAVELLAESGYADGVGMPAITVSIPGGVDNQRIAELMRESWKELGITTVIETIPWAVYFDFIEEEQFMVTTVSWIGDFADPLTFLDMWTEGSNLNNSRYVNPAYDELINAAMGQTGTTRYLTLAEAEQLLLDDAIVLPISHSPSVSLINLELIDGWYANPLDIHPMKYLRFSDGEPLPNVAKR